MSYAAAFGVEKLYRLGTTISATAKTSSNGNFEVVVRLAYGPPSFFHCLKCLNATTTFSHTECLPNRRPCPQPAAYTVTSVGPDGKESKETFDFLVVATGLNQTCSGLQLGPDGGGASHTCSIRGNRAFAAKKVVVVGLGESSSDATSDIANVASEVNHGARTSR